MPLRGGASDKFGNRYEMWWTVLKLTEVMAEEASLIRLEPPGQDGDGAEFYLDKNGHREFHQVKRQHTQLGRWSLDTLAGKHVLSRFWEKLKVADQHCVFVSGYAADELADLSEQASSASSFTEFEQEFLASSKDRRNNFATLQKYWAGCTPESAYEGLKRVHVETISENLLREHVDFRLASLVAEDAGKTASVLATYILDQIHQEIRGYDIWNHLSSRDIRRRQWNNDPRVLAAIEAQNARYLTPLREDAIAGTVIPRSEVTDIMTMLESRTAKRGILISGEAGGGKSGIALQVADAVQQRNWPLLAFRIDRLNTMSSPKDVGHQLDLPESPVTVLANVAQSKHSLLIIDQLDAISKVSGRNSHFFECVNELLRQVKLHPQMHVLLICRKFDIQNDNRLKNLTGKSGISEEITIGHLPHDTVKDAVQKMGLEVQLLNAKQLDLLSIPLHLKLLSEIANDEATLPLDFKTSNDLYDKFWKHKQHILKERLGRPIQWAPAIDILCNYMSNARKLAAPKIITEEFEADAEAMASERVLIADGPNYSFFHETFFDYAFARRFVASNKSLLSLLLEDEQHLFRRAQVRQILVYSREADLDRYLIDLNEVISSSQVRFHIKQVVFAILRQISSPTEQEWNIIAPLLEAPTDMCHAEAWQLLTVASWFRLAKSTGIFEQWLSGVDENRTDQAIRLLGMLARDIPDEVVELLETRDTNDPAWRNRLIHVMSYAQLSKSRRLSDLFLRLLYEGALDSLQDDGLWFMIYSLKEDKPEWYCEILGTYLNRHLNLNLAKGISNPFAPRFIPDISNEENVDSATLLHQPGTIRDTQHDHSFSEVAQKAPAAFTQYVFDFILRIMELNAVRKNGPLYRDTIWPYRTFGSAHGVQEVLFYSLEQALAGLAIADPSQFAAYAARLNASDGFVAQIVTNMAEVLILKGENKEEHAALAKVPLPYS